MVSGWSSAFTRKSLEDVLIRLQFWSQRRLRQVWNGSCDDFFSRRCQDVFRKTFSRPERLKTSLGCLENVSWKTSWQCLEKRSLRLPFQTNKDVFETKIKTFFTTSLCRLGIVYNGTGSSEHQSRSVNKVCGSYIADRCCKIMSLLQNIVVVN